MAKEEGSWAFNSGFLTPVWFPRKQSKMKWMKKIILILKINLTSFFCVSLCWHGNTCGIKILFILAANQVIIFYPSLNGRDLFCTIPKD